MLTETQPDYETDLAARYNLALHAKCTMLRRKRLECSWDVTSHCRWCGRPIPTLLDNQPGTLS